MPQLTKGARKALDQIHADLADIEEARALAHDEAFDPRYVRDRLAEIAEAQARLARRLRDELEPLLERQAPQFERRLAELEKRVEGLEQHKVMVLDMERRKVG